MNMESHVNKICQTAYLHLRNIKKSGLISQKMHAFITSRLDFVNAVLYDHLPKFLKAITLTNDNPFRTLTYFCVN